MWDFINPLLLGACIVLAFLGFIFWLPILLAEKDFYKREWTPEDAELELRKLKRELHGVSPEGQRAKWQSIHARIDYLEVKVLRPKAEKPPDQKPEDVAERAGRTLRERATNLVTLQKTIDEIETQFPELKTGPSGLRSRWTNMKSSVRSDVMDPNK